MSMYATVWALPSAVLGLYDEAMKEFETAIEQDKNEIMALYNAGGDLFI